MGLTYKDQMIETGTGKKRKIRRKKAADSDTEDDCDTVELGSLE